MREEREAAWKSSIRYVAEIVIEIEKASDPTAMTWDGRLQHCTVTCGVQSGVSIQFSQQSNMVANRRSLKTFELYTKPIVLQLGMDMGVVHRKVYCECEGGMRL